MTSLLYLHLFETQKTTSFSPFLSIQTEAIHNKHKKTENQFEKRKKKKNQSPVLPPPTSNFSATKTDILKFET